MMTAMTMMMTMMTTISALSLQASICLAALEPPRPPLWRASPSSSVAAAGAAVEAGSDGGLSALRTLSDVRCTVRSVPARWRLRSATRELEIRYHRRYDAINVRRL